MVAEVVRHCSYTILGSYYIRDGASATVKLSPIMSSRSTTTPWAMGDGIGRCAQSLLPCAEDADEREVERERRRHGRHLQPQPQAAVDREVLRDGGETEDALVRRAARALGLEEEGQNNHF